MGLQDITDAATAQNALTGRINGFMDGVDADVAAAIADAQTALAVRQAGYDALAANLRGIVTSAMDFRATWAPSQPDNPGYGGSYQSLKALVEGTPNGSRVTVDMLGTETYDLTEIVKSKERLVYLLGNGTSAATWPVMTFGHSDNGVNQVWSGGFQAGNGDFWISRVALDLGDVPSGNTAAYIGAPIRLELHHRSQVRLQLADVTVTGGNGVSLMKCYNGNIADCIATDVQLDGDVSLFRVEPAAILRISSNSVVLANGAGTYTGTSSFVTET